MADNTTLNSGSGGDTIATDDIGGIKHQRVKVQHGADGSATDVSTSSPLPVGGAAAENAAASGNPNLVGGRYDLTPRTLGDGDVGAIALDADGAVQVSDGGNTLTIDGTVTANLSATDNAVLDQIEVNTSYGDNTGGGVEAGALRVTIANDSTGLISVDDNGGSLTIDGTVTANLSATDNAVLDQIEVNTSYGDNTGGGVEAGALRVTIANDSTGVLTVDDGGTTLSVDDGGGALTVDGTVTANAGTGTFTVDLGANNDIQGDIAHDAADSGNPVKVGAYAVNAEATAAANADRVNLVADLVGKLITLPYTNPENMVNGNGNSTGTGDTAVLAAAGVGVRNYVTTIFVTNSSSTDTHVIIKDGATEKFRIPAPGNGGAVINLSVPLRGTANTAINFASATGVTTMYVGMTGYKGV